jgi:tetratricopeptide (TPR) repeat protein
MTVSYVQQGNIELAITQQEKMFSIAEKANDAAAMSGDLLTIGFLLQESNRPDQAREKYQRGLAVILESKLSDDVKKNAKRFGLYNMAQIAIAKKDVTAAKSLTEDFRKEAQATGNQFQLWLVHELAGRTAIVEKEFDRAVAELQQSNLQNPQNLYRIAVALEAKGDRATAEAMYKRVVEFNGLNNLNYSLVRGAAQKKAG